MKFLWGCLLLLRASLLLCKPITVPTPGIANARASQPFGYNITDSRSTSIANERSTSTSKVKYAGVNFAGFEFGCTQDGYCPIKAVTPPGQAGLDQLAHFMTADRLNAARIPVSWQALVNNDIGGPLQGQYFEEYYAFVQACVKQGGQFCIVDVHNYARWNGQTVGQSASVPTAALVDLWRQVAEKFKGTPQVAFGLMNEPHNLDLHTWIATLQAVVTAIRKTGATNTILLPGSQFSAGGALLDGSGDALAAVKNPDGSTAGLVFDIHVYLDYDHTGTHSTCSSNMITEAAGPLAKWLRKNRRQAFMSETGGSSDHSCVTYVCQLVDFLNQNADVYLGYTSWGAGSFGPNYVLSNTPLVRTEQGGGSRLVDQPLVEQCIVNNR